MFFLVWMMLERQIFCMHGLFKTSGSLVKAAGYYGNTASVVSMVAEGKGSYGSNSNN